MQSEEKLIIRIYRLRLRAIHQTKEPNHGKDNSWGITGHACDCSTVVGSNPTGAGNLDITTGADSKFLYTLNSANGTIGIFAIQKDGPLAVVGSFEGISAKSGFNRIAAN